MTNIDKEFSIENFGWINPVSVSIVLNRQYDREQEQDTYQGIILLELDDNTEEGHFIHVPLNIFGPDRLQVCLSVCQWVAILISADEIYSNVSVFNDKGDLEEEFDLNEETMKSMVSEKRVSH